MKRFVLQPLYMWKSEHVGVWYKSFTLLPDAGWFNYVAIPGV